MSEKRESVRVKFSEESLKEIRRMFKSKDIDDSGTIDKDELGECLRVVGFCPTDFDIDLLIKQFDVNGDGKLRIDEIIENLHIVNSHSVQGDEIRDAFKKIDVNNDGFLRLPQLKKVLTANEGLSPEEASKYISYLVSNFDKNNDGKFDYSEFVEMWMCGELKYETEAADTKAD